MAILVTGAAGFIGFHVASALLARGERVLGLDCLNEYYDIRLKQARLRELATEPGFLFQRTDISDRQTVFDFIDQHCDIDGIIHLAAQAGVRYSLIDPYAYVQSNVMGHLVMQEAARRTPRLKHFVYASSSSVYGLNRKMPFIESDSVDTPISLYAATKRADELMSHVYGHLFQLPQTGLRFFTVYGPWGRPDMAYFSFARAILRGEPINVYGDGLLKRDFTYIDDIVAGVIGCLDCPPGGEMPNRVLNIGNNRAELVNTLIQLLEKSLGKNAIINNMPRPALDVEATFASIDAIHVLTGYVPATPLSSGIPRFVAWFLEWEGRPDASEASSL